MPKSPTLINYTRILSNSDYHLGASMWNSVRTTVLSIVLIVAFSFIVGYILSRIHFKLNRLIYVMFLMGMLIPIHSLLVPIYVVFKNAVFPTSGSPCCSPMCPSDSRWEFSW